MSQAMCFRPMQRGDVSRIAQLEQVCFRSPWSEKSLMGEMKNPLAHYRVGVPIYRHRLPRPHSTSRIKQ